LIVYSKQDSIFSMDWLVYFAQWKSVTKDTFHQMSECYQQANIFIPLSSFCGIFLIVVLMNSNQSHDILHKQTSLSQFDILKSRKVLACKTLIIECRSACFVIEILFEKCCNFFSWLTDHWFLSPSKYFQGPQKCYKFYYFEQWSICSIYNLKNVSNKLLGN